LTEEGLGNYKEVARTIFQYIGMMRTREPQEWIMDELMRISEINFRSKQKSPSWQTTSSLAGVMQKPYDREALLSGPTVIREFNATRIREAMSYLRPDNFRMTIASQDFPGGWDRKEKWYGTEYKVEKLAEGLLAEVRAAFESKEQPAELHFPHKNEYIPSRLDMIKEVVEQPKKEPKLIRNDDIVRIWWKKDDQYRDPKANVRIFLRTHITNATPREMLMSSLYCDVVNDALVECSHDAKISGLVYDLTNHVGGLSITVSGYKDKLLVLLEKVLSFVRVIEVEQGRFAIIHKLKKQSLRNWDYKQPFDQVCTYSRMFKNEKSWMTEDVLPELDGVTAEDVRQFFPKILAQGQIEVLAHGTLDKEEALKIARLAERKLRPKNLPADQNPIRCDLMWPSGCNFVYERQLKDPENFNNCIEYNLYAGNSRDGSTRAKLLLIVQMLKEPCFHELRTKQQLGYWIFSHSSFEDTWAGYSIIVQSEKDCKLLEGHIEDFLNAFEKTLEEMSEDEYEAHKRATINNCLKKLDNLSEECALFWTKIQNASYDFTQGKC
jgi:insulysin